jgi:hypothetical protein
MARLKTYPLQIPDQFKREIKIRASAKCITMKLYIVRAITEQIRKDNLLDFQEALGDMEPRY